MNEKRKNELKVGLTVLIGLIILTYGFFRVKEWSVTGEYPLTFRFPTSSGLQTGDQVTVNGVKAGRVDQVTVDGTSVLVRILLREDIRLTEDAKISIQMLELMGGKKIDIVQGKSAGLLDRTKIIVGSVDPDIAGALEVVGQVKGEVVQMSRRANELLTNLNELAGDTDLRASLKSTFANLSGMMGELRQMVAENRTNAGRISENLSRLTAQFDTIAREIRPRLNAALDGTASTLSQTDTLVTEMKFLLRDIRQGQGILHQALYDSTFTVKIDTLMARVNRVMETLLDPGIKVRVRL